MEDIHYLLELAQSRDREIRSVARQGLADFREKLGAKGLKGIVARMNCAGPRLVQERLLDFIFSYGEEANQHIIAASIGSCTSSMGIMGLRRLGLKGRVALEQIIVADPSALRTTKALKLFLQDGEEGLKSLLRISFVFGLPEKNWSFLEIEMEIAKLIARAVKRSRSVKKALEVVIEHLLNKKPESNDSIILVALGMIGPVSPLVEQTLREQFAAGVFFAGVALLSFPKLSRRTAIVVADKALDGCGCWRDKERSRLVAELLGHFGKHRDLAIKPIQAYLRGESEGGGYAYILAVQSAGLLKLEDSTIISLISHRQEWRPSILAALLEMGPEGRAPALFGLSQLIEEQLPKPNAIGL